jgi:high-affinity Fe2+/Pb2+ permease
MATTAMSRNKSALMQPAALFHGEDKVGSAQVPLLEDDMEAQLPTDTAPKRLPTFWNGLVMGFIAQKLAVAMVFFLQFSNVFVAHYYLTTALICTVIYPLFLWVVWCKFKWHTNDQATAIDSGNSSDFLRYFGGAVCGIWLAAFLAVVVLKKR